MKSPCKDCPKRHPFCHASCTDYLDFAAELDKQKRTKYFYFVTDPLNCKKPKKGGRKGRR